MSLEARNLRFAYGRDEVLAGVSLSIPAGSRTAILGPNGAGKTTLLKILAGLLPPSSGDVLLEGRLLRDYSRREMAQRLTFVSQAVHRETPFRVRDVVTMGRTPHVSFLGRLSARDRERVEAAMADTEVASLAGRRLAELSAGEFQRTLLAMALAQDAPVILLDEPTAFLDLRRQVGFLRLLSRLNRTAGRTVVAVTHDLSLAVRFFDRIVLLSGGRVVAEGSPAEAVEAERIREVFGVAVDVERSPDGRVLGVRLRDDPEDA